MIIDDNNARILVNDPTRSYGLIPRNFQDEPYGEGYAKPIDFPVIPRAEWPDRIADMERTKSRLTDICDDIGLTVLNQSQTNYCWCNGVVHCVEVVRAVQGQELVRLSPASVGGPITGYRNVGGWGTKALEYVVSNGIMPQDKWPANAIDSQYAKPENEPIRKKYQADEWFDLKPRSFDELMTCLLMRIPCAVAYNWWGHLVTAMDPYHDNGKFGVRIDNSWGVSWGDKGRSVLMESKGTPDECVAPKVVTAS